MWVFCQKEKNLSMNPVWLIKLLFPQLYKYKPLYPGIEILSRDNNQPCFIIAFLRRNSGRTGIIFKAQMV